MNYFKKFDQQKQLVQLNTQSVIELKCKCTNFIKNTSIYHGQHATMYKHTVYWYVQRYKYVHKQKWEICKVPNSWTSVKNTIHQTFTHM